MSPQCCTTGNFGIELFSSLGKCKWPCRPPSPVGNTLTTEKYLIQPPLRKNQTIPLCLILNGYNLTWVGIWVMWTPQCTVDGTACKINFVSTIGFIYLRFCETGFNILRLSTPIRGEIHFQLQCIIYSIFVAKGLGLPIQHVHSLKLL